VSGRLSRSRLILAILTAPYQSRTSSDAFVALKSMVAHENIFTLHPQTIEKRGSLGRKADTTKRGDGAVATEKHSDGLAKAYQMRLNYSTGV